MFDSEASNSYEYLDEEAKSSQIIIKSLCKMNNLLKKQKDNFGAIIDLLKEKDLHNTIYKQLRCILYYFVYKIENGENRCATTIFNQFMNIRKCISELYQYPLFVDTDLQKMVINFYFKLIDYVLYPDQVNYANNVTFVTSFTIIITAFIAGLRT